MEEESESREFGSSYLKMPSIKTGQQKTAECLILFFPGDQSLACLRIPTKWRSWQCHRYSLPEEHWKLGNLPNRRAFRC
jgi:hypothetical protein